MEIKSLKTSQVVDISKFGKKAFLLNKLYNSGFNIPNGILLSNKKVNHSFLMKELKVSECIINNDILCIRISKIENNLIYPNSLSGIGLSEGYIDALPSEIDKFYHYKLYVKFIENFSINIFNLKPEIFEDISSEFSRNNQSKYNLSKKINFAKEIIKIYKKIFYENSNVDFPNNKFIQIELALKTLTNFDEENSKKINSRYQNFKKIKNNPMSFGIIIQKLVILKEGLKVGFGSYYDLNPETGRKKHTFKFLNNFLNLKKQKIYFNENENKKNQFRISLKNNLKKINYEILKVLKERYKIFFYYSLNDIYIISISLPNRSLDATFEVLVDLVNNDILSSKEAVLRIDPYSLVNFLHPQIDPKSSGEPLGGGLSASPGAAKGFLVFNKKDALKYNKAGKKFVFVRTETSPKDIYAMKMSEGVITLRGGLTSHAAVIARGLGLPCIVGVKNFRLNNKKKIMISSSGEKFKSGDFITIDGTTGNIFRGNQNMILPKNSKSFDQIMKWVDQYKTISVRANADTEDDFKIAKKFLADGIGLCRSEHMFLEKNRLQLFQKMVLSKKKDKRKKCLEDLKYYHQKDLKILFDIAENKPFAIRLLDPPLKDFFSNSKNEKNKLRRKFLIKEKDYNETLININEYNPMLGKRGVRLGLTEKDIYEMQISAIFGALKDIYDKRKVIFSPEIIIPMVSSVREIKLIKNMILNIKGLYEEKYKISFDIKFGVMIETPRSALISRDIAPLCDFFNFGTNDLTQMVYGLSRDDKGQFIEYYTKKNVFGIDPFSSIDVKGVGKLIKDSLKNAKKGNQELFFGICGEHGGDPTSINFFSSQKFDYISCSPFRIPIAKLAAAQSAIVQEKNEKRK